MRVVKWICAGMAIAFLLFGFVLWVRTPELTWMQAFLRYWWTYAVAVVLWAGYSFLPGPPEEARHGD